MATNLGALLFFLPHGAVLWGIGLVLGVCEHVRRLPGRAHGRQEGSKFIRIVFLSVVGALILKLGSDIWHDNFA